MVARSVFVFLYLNNLLLYGVLDQFPPVVQVELFHHVGAVYLDGLDGYIQYLTNLFIGVTFGDQLQHLALSGCQEFSLVCGAGITESQVIFNHQAGDGGGQGAVIALQEWGLNLRMFGRRSTNASRRGLAGLCQVQLNRLK